MKTIGLYIAIVSVYNSFTVFDPQIEDSLIGPTLSSVPWKPQPTKLGFSLCISSSSSDYQPAASVLSPHARALVGAAYAKSLAQSHSNHKGYPLTRNRQ